MKNIAVKTATLLLFVTLIGGEAAEYLTVGIGADWRDSSEKPLQVFAGYKHAVTNEPTVVAGHNVPLSKWDEVVGNESEKIQKIIGLKQPEKSKENLALFCCTRQGSVLK